MRKANVYFYPLTSNKPKEVSKAALKLFEHIVKEEKIQFSTNLPIKVHSGEPGNETFIKPASFNGVVDYLKENNISPYFIETNTAYDGPRFKEKSHLKVGKEHGFTKIPFVIADENGFGHTEVPIKGGKHFKTIKIANKLANQKQILVMTHFKGHQFIGFGGALKMLGIGFSSGRGKTEIHSSKTVPEGELINWNCVYEDMDIFERIAEAALAASQGKKHIYMSYAINITKDCDCDGIKMKPIYKDLGIFASLDPVAIDKAVIDALVKREGKLPFKGTAIIDYAEKIGVGIQSYSLIKAF